MIKSKSACNSIKGTVSQDGYFFERPNISISIFCEYAVGFQGLSKFFHYPTTIFNFLIASLKFLTNFENAY
jgi:hypothetical protein